MSHHRVDPRGSRTVRDGEGIVGVALREGLRAYGLPDRDPVDIPGRIPALVWSTQQRPETRLNYLAAEIRQ